MEEREANAKLIAKYGRLRDEEGGLVDGRACRAVP